MSVNTELTQLYLGHKYFNKQVELNYFNIRYFYSSSIHMQWHVSVVKENMKESEISSFFHLFPHIDEICHVFSLLFHFVAAALILIAPLFLPLLCCWNLLRNLKTTLTSLNKKCSRSLSFLGLKKTLDTLEKKAMSLEGNFKKKQVNICDYLLLF